MTIHWTENFSKPATQTGGERLTGAARAVVSQVSQFLAKRRQQRIDRDAFRHLLTLDNEILDDIGVSRADVEWASSLPLTFNASQELERLARGGSPDRPRRERPRGRI